MTSSVMVYPFAYQDMLHETSPVHCSAVPAGHELSSPRNNAGSIRLAPVAGRCSVDRRLYRRSAPAGHELSGLPNSAGSIRLAPFTGRCSVDRRLYRRSDCRIASMVVTHAFLHVPGVGVQNMIHHLARLLQILHPPPQHLIPLRVEAIDPSRGSLCLLLIPG